VAPTDRLGGVRVAVPPQVKDLRWQREPDVSADLGAASPFKRESLDMNHQDVGKALHRQPLGALPAALALLARGHLIAVHHLFLRKLFHACVDVASTNLVMQAVRPTSPQKYEHLVQTVMGILGVR
jgi:hypothetical protein